MVDIVRVLRIVEYTGPRDLVEGQIAKSIHGQYLAHDGQLTIRVATIGSYPEILDTIPDGVTEAVIPEPADKFDFTKPFLTGLACSTCFAPQFRTPSGDTCENGHGGATGIMKLTQ
jgi:hypothetical protein